MANVDEFGLTNRVNIDPITANTMRKLAINIVVYIVTLPKNSR